MSDTDDEPRFMPVPNLPPGVGIVTVDPKIAPLAGTDHFAAWGAAIDQALDNIQGSAGNFKKNIKLKATVQVTNPGVIVEYIASIDDH
jgi:hypothetical protein